jgi:hypothetical protein
MAERATTGTANSFGISGFIQRLSRGKKSRATSDLCKFLNVVAW